MKVKAYTREGSPYSIYLSVLTPGPTHLSLFLERLRRLWGEDGDGVGMCYEVMVVED